MRGRFEPARKEGASPTIPERWAQIAAEIAQNVLPVQRAGRALLWKNVGAKTAYFASSTLLASNPLPHIILPRSRDAASSSCPAIAGKGDRALARWKGRLTRRSIFVAKDFVTARAPSTMLRFARMVPLPRYRGGGCIVPRSRDADASEFCRHATVRSPSKLSLRKEGRRSADKRTTGSALPQKRKPAGFAASTIASLPRSLRDQAAAPSPFSAPPRSCAESVTPRLGSGPRFLESPGANGRTLPGASAASTSQSGQVPDGTMPRTARMKVTSSIQVPRPPHRSAVTGRRPFDGRALIP